MIIQCVMSGFVCALEEVNGKLTQMPPSVMNHGPQGLLKWKKCERLNWTETKQRRWMIITQFIITIQNNAKTEQL